MNQKPDKILHQNADKIFNIERIENVNVDMSDLEETIKKLNQAMDSLPDLVERSIFLTFSKLSPDFLNANKEKSMAPIPLKDLYERTFSEGDIVMSHWQIDRCIGKGSFSTVYEAHHTDSMYKSAIKIIHSSFEYFDIFKTDVTHRIFNASQMIHMELDNLVKLRGTGYIVEYEDHEAIGGPYGPQDIIIRMELLHPLSDVLRLKMPTKAEVIQLGIDICKALEFCYSNNIIHCDVKPANIYLTEWGRYKLGDFSASTKTGNPRNPEQIGTLKYMAPEIYAGKPFSPNVDTYSLGLVMYELLKKAEEDDFYKRLTGEPLPVIPDIDQPLQSIILKACSYDPEDRFSSPTEMLNELLEVK